MTQTVTPMDSQALLSPAQGAELAAVSRKTVDRVIDRGELLAVHVGRQLRINPTELDRSLVRQAGGD